VQGSMDSMSDVPSETLAVTMPVAMGLAVFGATFTSVGLCLLAGFWRRRLIRKQLMGEDGILTTEGTIVSKHCVTSSNGQGASTTRHMASYYFTARTPESSFAEVQVDNATVDGTSYSRYQPPCKATVRYLEREPRRSALQDAAEQEVRQTCSLGCLTCIAAVFTLVGAAIALGISLGLGVDVAARVGGAVTFLVLIAVVLVFVARALSLHVHNVICCLSRGGYCSEFGNVTITSLHAASNPVASQSHDLDEPGDVALPVVLVPATVV